MTVLANLWSQRLEQGFDRWSRSYDRDVLPKLERRGHSYPSLASRIAQDLPLSGDTTSVLELGVGTGLVGASLRTQLPENVALIGLDLSSEMLKRAEGRDCYQTLVKSDASRLPFADASFSALCSCFMFL